MHCINDKIPGWMSRAELIWLHAQALDMASVAEIGCWRGRSTYALLTGCLGPVYAIDHWKGDPNDESQRQEAYMHDIFSEFMQNVGWFNNLRVMRMSSEMASMEFDNTGASVEMLFIDGDHTQQAAGEDLRMWMGKCTKLLCGHDLDITGVEKALEQYEVKWQHGPGSIWYAYKGEGF